MMFNAPQEWIFRILFEKVHRPETGLMTGMDNTGRILFERKAGISPLISCSGEVVPRIALHNTYFADLFATL